MGHGECAPAITAVHYVYNETIHQVSCKKKKKYKFGELLEGIRGANLTDYREI